MFVGSKDFRSPARALVRSLSKSRDVHKEKRRELESEQKLVDLQLSELRTENERLQKVNAQLLMQNTDLRFEQDVLKKIEAAFGSAVASPSVRRKVR